MQVSVFIPCYIHQLKPMIGIQMIQVLERLGCEVKVITDALCCGQAAYNSGFQKEAKQVVTHFVAAYKKEDYIVVPSASCAGFLKNYAPRLFQNETKEDLDTVQQVSHSIIEFADFIANNCDARKLQIDFPHAIAYHTSCAALREYKSTDSTLKILQQIPALQLIPFAYRETCCGFGGSFAEKFSDLSISMAKHKLEMLLNANAQYVVSNDYSCQLHLESVAKKNNTPISFLHLAELLSHS